MPKRQDMTRQQHIDFEQVLREYHEVIGKQYTCTVPDPLWRETHEELLDMIEYMLTSPTGP